MWPFRKTEPKLTLAVARAALAFAKAEGDEYHAGRLQDDVNYLTRADRLERARTRVAQKARGMRFTSEDRLT